MQQRWSRTPVMLAAAAMAAALVILLTSAAFGYDELIADPVATPDDPPSHSEVPGCFECHSSAYYDCGNCHYGFDGPHGGGPHGHFDDGRADPTYLTDKCAQCHTIHDSGGTPESVKLLPRGTVGSSCEACHDGTGGHGVYGTLTARGVAVGAAHRIETEAVTAIPGGDAATGGDRAQTFRGPNGTLTCSDCHTPHGDPDAMVTPFIGDRQRTTIKWQKSGARHHVKESSKLLKRRPTGAATSTLDYGSDWCLACHAGRVSGGALHNHPVDSLSVRADTFTYNRVSAVTTYGPTRSTEILGMGGWSRPGNPWVDPTEYAQNRQYLIPYPRSADQGTHYPICQQCHEDSRNVGSLDATGVADTIQLQITAEDGVVATDNPRFQNFPHETENRRFLVETDDDLCLNCHPTGALP